MVLSASGVIAFSRLAVRLLAEEEFFSAWQFVPVLCLAMVFAAFSTFLSSVYVVSKKSGLSFWTALLGAGSNVLMNLLLIPHVGVMGAAAVTMQLPGWISIQAVCMTLLLILNGKPLLLAVKKLFGACRKGENI